MDELILKTRLSCREAACAFATMLLQTEPEVEVVGIYTELTELNLDKSISLDKILPRTPEEKEFGIHPRDTELPLPITWAMEKKKKFDVFVIFADIRPIYDHQKRDALKNYREAMGIPDARLVVVGMRAKGLHVARPNDTRMLDICGFESSVPELLREFALGNI